MRSQGEEREFNSCRPLEWLLRCLMPRTSNTNFVATTGGDSHGICDNRGRMQIILEYSGSPEQYVDGAAHKEVLPPPACPACGETDCLESLGYYTRGLSRKGSPGVMPIAVRRFRCAACGVTVSLLPNFAQPYRLVRNETVQMFFDGERDADDVLRWYYLLRRYSRRFCWWFPELFVRTAIRPGRSPPVNMFEEFWGIFKDLWGPLALATGRLVRGFQVTPFGAYRCHATPSD